MASFAIPLSGLNADSTALNTIANNLSNMSTTGFKAQTTDFSTLFSQQVGSNGSGDEIQVGEGTQVASNTTDFSQGSSITSGTSSADAEIIGNGFFLVNDNGTNVLTRDGSFSTSSSGVLQTADGLDVMGYPAVNGKVNTGGSLTAITIPVSGTEAASATTSFGMNTVLNSDANVGDTATGTVKVYDSLGNGYDATVTYKNTGTGAWTYQVTLPDTLNANTSVAGTTSYNFGVSGGATATVDPSTSMTITGVTAGGTTATITAPTVTAGESITAYATALQGAITAAGITGVTATANAATGQLSVTGANFSTTGGVIQDAIPSANASGTMTFNANGTLVSPAADISGISFSGLSGGASALNMTWDVLGSSGTPTITTAAQASATSNTTQDGYPAGTYQSFAIAANGTVNVTYSNGNTQAVGQLALGNVANQQGLQSLGNSEYASTVASGNTSIGISGTNGLGTITGSALEGSNVNISAEFSNLIVAQRAFEANAKAVTTFDTLTQETINMIH